MDTQTHTYIHTVIKCFLRPGVCQASQYSLSLSSLACLHTPAFPGQCENVYKHIISLIFICSVPLCSACHVIERETDKGTHTVKLIHLLKTFRMVMHTTTRSFSNYVQFIFRTNTLTIPTLLFFKALACGVDGWNIWLLVTGYSLAMEIPVVSVVSRERGVKSPLDLRRTF